MLRFVIGLFLVLHGLVHLWYVTLSQRLVAFRPAMGWSGTSWLFSHLLGDAPERAVASGLYVVATLGFVASGIGLVSQHDWWRPMAVGTAAFSLAIILLFWDGRLQLLVEKGLPGLLINVGILLALLVLWKLIMPALLPVHGAPLV